MTEHQTSNSAKTSRVDMDEFLKTDAENTVLETFGVSTCTALLAAYPRRFAYLAHISPRDQVYENDKTDLVGQVSKHIKKFQIYPYEQSELIFVIVAPHLNTLEAVVNKLVDQGFFLSQIRFVYHPKAKSAQVIYDYKQDQLCVSWRMPDGDFLGGHHHLEEAADLGVIMESLREEAD